MRTSPEPERLRRGKQFHRTIQQEWLRTTKDGQARPERSIRKVNGRNGRVDILVEELGDFVALVEIKATDWNRMAEGNVPRNARRHIRQLWTYIDAALELEGQQVCPGIIFPTRPRDPRRTDLIEKLFNDEGIQVVWHDESIDALKNRKASQSDSGHSWPTSASAERER